MENHLVNFLVGAFIVKSGDVLSNCILIGPDPMTGDEKMHAYSWVIGVLPGLYIVYKKCII